MEHLRLTGAFFSMLILLPTSSLASAPEETVILNKDSYFSVYGVYGPHEKAQDEKSTKKRRRGRKDKRYILTPPPAEWTKADFDASDWPRRRKLDLRHFKSAYIRTLFQVKDTSGPVTLDLTYWGGARVYINGHEIGSGHLQDGQAEVYPPEAYRLLEEEKHPKDRWPVPLYLPQQFERMPVSKEYEGWRVSGKVLMQKAGWQRMINLRNRKLSLSLPAEHLVKGTNVLAIEVHRPDRHPKGSGYYGGKFFPHLGVVNLELKADSAKVASAIVRPGKTRVWAEDMHMRVYNADFLPEGHTRGELQLVGAQGGTYSGQLVLSTKSELSGLKVSVSPLKQVKSTGASGEKTITPYSIEVRFAKSHTLTGIGSAMGGRREGSLANNAHHNFLERYLPVEIEHHGSSYHSRKKNPEVKKIFEELKYFDQLSTAAPKSIAANSTQPIWVSVNVPRNTSAGHYGGSVKVEAGGGFSQSIPLKLEVVDWQVPQARDFTTLVWADQNPYSVAAQYKVKTWSEDHMKLVERSLIQLGRIGADVLMIPVVNKTEFSTDNIENPIKWIRKKDGSLTFDYSIMDKYIDLAAKHWGTPRFIVFIVVPGGAKKPLTVSVKDEAGGKVEELRLDPSEENSCAWGQFATSLYNHMHSRGLHRSMYWGLNKDIAKNAALQPLLAEFAPEVMWTVTAHGRMPVNYDQLVSRIYGKPRAPDIIKRGKVSYGWKSQQLLFANSRVQSGIYHFEGYFPPFVHRPWAEVALSNGYRGVGRFGADHWGRWHKHFRAGHKYTPGFGTMNILWPGTDGPDGSIRLEIFREGLQEAEAKVFLEKAVDQGLVNEEWIQKISKLLMDRIYAVSQIRHNPNPPAVELTHRDNHQGWRERSRALYRMAAEVAKQVSAGGGTANKQEKTEQAEAKPDFEILFHREAFIVEEGQTIPLSFGFVNRTEKTVQWTASAEPAWASAKNASGNLNAGKVQVLQGLFKPVGEESHAVITIKDQGGKLLCQRKIPFRIPVRLPTGKAIPVKALPDSITVVKTSPEKSRYKSEGLRWAADNARKDKGVLLMEPDGETITFNLENAGIKAFAAKLSWSRADVNNRNSRFYWKMNAVHCEIYMDGKLVKKSPAYKGIDVSPTLVVLEGLEKAKTVKLVCTYGEGDYKNLKFISLTNPTFYASE